MHGCGEAPGGKRDLGWNWTERAGVSIIILRDKRALEKIRCLKVCSNIFDAQKYNTFVQKDDFFLFVAYF